MSQYKYPPRYFCGPGLKRYPSKLLDKGLRLFNEKIAIKNPITGETELDGVLLDFNCGLRLQLPEGDWHVRIAADELIFLDEDASRVTLISMEKFLVEWEITLWLDGEPVFYHRFDPNGQSVHFIFAQPTLGDNLAFFPYVEEFLRAFDCRLTCTVPKPLREIFARYHSEAAIENELPEDSYACFYLSAWSNLPIATASDMRAMPLELFAQSILSPRLSRPSKIIYSPSKPRSIEEPYVCIGVQASYNPKGWLNPNGWDAVVEHLKRLGYRVLCIDRDRKCSNYGLTIEMPRGAEDFSGDYSLLDRINQLAYADFFVGLSSGLAWLAWAVDIPVVMISGITEPWYEFDTPYRVSNPLVCHGCFNSLALDPTKILDCTLFKGTDRIYECSKNISARQVIDAIERLIEDKNLSGVKNIDSSD